MSGKSKAIVLVVLAVCLAIEPVILKRDISVVEVLGSVAAVAFVGLRLYLVQHSNARDGRRTASRWRVSPRVHAATCKRAFRAPKRARSGVAACYALRWVSTRVEKGPWSE